jgi:hypothetical protein
MEEKEKQVNFNLELIALLKKYNAEIILQDFGREYMRDEKIVVTFGYDENLYQEKGSGIIPDLILGTFVC